MGQRRVCHRPMMHRAADGPRTASSRPVTPLPTAYAAQMHRAAPGTMAPPCCGHARPLTETVEGSVTAVACTSCGALWLCAEPVARPSRWASVLEWCAHVAPLWGPAWAVAITKR